MPDACLLPGGWKPGPDPQATGQLVGQDAEQTLNDGPRGRPDAVRKVAVAFARKDVRRRCHPDITRAKAHEHTIEKTPFQERHGTIGAARLPIGKGRMGGFLKGNVIDRPHIRHPVRRRDRVVARGHARTLHRNLGELRVHEARHLPGFKRGRRERVQRMIECPETGRGMDRLTPQQILVLGKPAPVTKPQLAAHRLENETGFFLKRRGILAKQPGNTGRHQIVPVIVGRGVGHPSPAVHQVIARPDAAVGLVKGQFFGTERTAE